MVQKLIEAYNLQTYCSNITIHRASREEVIKFHHEEYVDTLLSPPEEKDILEEYGLLYDCPVFDQLSEYVRVIAGSTISAAKFLMDGGDIAINWHGGRHHAKRSKASGFCYVNDIVLGIQELRKKYEIVAYVDFDLHHGDGVETAFKFSDKVTTISLHRRELGFFPGTGDTKDRGLGKGKGQVYNIPLKHGLSDQGLSKVVDGIVLPILEKIKPDVIVIQCGCDGLESDEHQEWNLSIKGLAQEIMNVVRLGKKVLLLGGGGYNHEQCARFYSYLTSLVLGLEIEFDLLPDTVDGLGYEFWDVNKKNMIDENNDTYIDELKTELGLTKMVT